MSDAKTWAVTVPEHNIEGVHVGVSDLSVEAETFYIDGGTLYLTANSGVVAAFAPGHWMRCRAKAGDGS